jgi:hypothetical protein
VAGVPDAVQEDERHPGTPTIVSELGGLAVSRVLAPDHDGFRPVNIATGSAIARRVASDRGLAAQVVGHVGTRVHPAAGSGEGR